MHFTIAADTDVGISKKINQDSFIIKKALIGNSEIVMAIICDGMGGLSKGELASATVIEVFSDWFDDNILYEFENINLEIIGEKWSLLIKKLNSEINEFGKDRGIRLGTTFTGALFVDEKYVVVHVGDSRLYHIGTKLSQITKDQTFIARAIENGELTENEAKNDSRRNVLLQCVGASKFVEPEIILGITQEKGYLFCSDGFRHVITDEEIYTSLNKVVKGNKKAMSMQIRKLIDLIKSRKEKDNITAIYIKVENIFDCKFENNEEKKKYTSHYTLKFLVIFFGIMSVVFLFLGIIKLF